MANNLSPYTNVNGGGTGGNCARYFCRKVLIRANARLRKQRLLVKDATTPG